MILEKAFLKKLKSRSQYGIADFFNSNFFTPKMTGAEITGLRFEEFINKKDTED
jgi:hypothetical protein